MAAPRIVKPKRASKVRAIRKASLTTVEQKALAEFFAYWWGTVSLRPMTWRPVLDHMQEAGLVASKDSLTLTLAGEKALELARPTLVRALKQALEAKPQISKP